MSKTLVNGIYAEHGRYTTYGNHACRCDACRAAWTAYHRERDHIVGRHLPSYVHHARVSVEAEIRDNHGSETRYCRGCRCAACREASAAARRRRRLNRLAETRAYERARWHKRKARA